MMAENFWDDHEKSQATVQNLNQLKKIVNTYEKLSQNFEFLGESLELIKIGRAHV